MGFVYIKSSNWFEYIISWIGASRRGLFLPDHAVNHRDVPAAINNSWEKFRNSVLFVINNSIHVPLRRFFTKEYFSFKCHCAPLVCVPALQGLLAVWWHNKPKPKTSVRGMSADSVIREEKRGWRTCGPSGGGRGWGHQVDQANTGDHRSTNFAAAAAAPLLYRVLQGHKSMADRNQTLKCG